MPSVDERPAKQWPPLRTATGAPDSRANASAAAMSGSPWHRTIARGRGWSRRGTAAVRADSYPGAPGTSTSPAPRLWSVDMPVVIPRLRGLRGAKYGAGEAHGERAAPDVQGRVLAHVDPCGNVVLLVALVALERAEVLVVGDLAVGLRLAGGEVDAQVGTVRDRQVGERQPRAAAGEHDHPRLAGRGALGRRPDRGGGDLDVDRPADRLAGGGGLGARGSLGKVARRHPGDHLLVDGRVADRRQREPGADGHRGRDHRAPHPP